MAEVRADELGKGDVLLLNGDRYVVLKAKVRGKLVHLVVDGRGGSFTSDVKAKTRYSRIDSQVTPAPSGNGKRDRDASRPVKATVPLHSPDGAQTRWANKDELEAPGEWLPSTGWDEPASKVESKLIDRLGAKLVAVEVEGGRLVVPPVSDATVLGHLATMHGVRFDGVTFAEAKVWAKANPGVEKPLSEVFTMLELEQAYATHEAQHRDFAALQRPHWHREKAPK